MIWLKGDYFVYLLLAMNIIATFGYAWEQNGPKFLYFLGAAILTFGVILME